MLLPQSKLQHGNYCSSFPEANSTIPNALVPLHAAASPVFLERIMQCGIPVPAVTNLGIVDFIALETQKYFFYSYKKNIHRK